MKNTLIIVIAFLASLALSPHAQAQSLLVNFQADDYTGGSSWTDNEGNVTAQLYVSGSTPVAHGTSVTTSGGFYFATGDVAGLDGLPSYSVAVGFTATGISAQTSSPYAFAGNGVLGGDISGYGAGDIGLSLSSHDNGIVAGGGVAGGNDVGVDDSNLPLNVPTGAVIVVQANNAGFGNPANGSISLYVNGSLAGQQTGLITQPFGESNAMFGGSAGSYGFGVGTLVGGSASSFAGDITQEQIYSGALTSSAAELLSNSISEDSVPEPGIWALLVAGLLPLSLWSRPQRS